MLLLVGCSQIRGCIRCSPDALACCQSLEAHGGGHSTVAVSLGRVLFLFGCPRRFLNSIQFGNNQPHAQCGSNFMVQRGTSISQHHAARHWSRVDLPHRWSRRLQTLCDGLVHMFPSTHLYPGPSILSCHLSTLMSPCMAQSSQAMTTCHLCAWSVV